MAPGLVAEGVDADEARRAEGREAAENGAGLVRQVAPVAFSAPTRTARQSPWTAARRGAGRRARLGSPGTVISR